MDPVEYTLEEILRSEGGYQKSPKDKGNFYNGKLIGTNYGITPEVYKEFYNKEPTVAAIKGLTEDDAKAIYKKMYIHPVTKNLGVPPEHPAFSQLVDMVVNSGYENAKPVIQRALGVKVDGKAGPGTRKAIQEEDPVQFNNKLVEKRKEYYQQITQQNPDNQAFIKGWLDRAERYRR